MLQQLESVKSKWGGKSQVIDKWLLERQALLVSYCKLAGINTHDDCLPNADEISEFCGVVIYCDSSVMADGTNGGEPTFLIPYQNIDGT